MIDTVRNAYYFSLKGVFTMTEHTMARRQRRQRRQRRNALAAWLVAAFSIAAILFIGIAACLDYAGKLMPEGGLPGLILEGIQNEAGPQGGEDGTDWNLRLVNRWNPLPEGYTVKLKELPGGEKVDERIYEPLMEMLEAAKEGNWDELPRVISGYRTQEVQQSLYDNKVSGYRAEGYSQEDAKAEADKWVALPGTSEHQLGLAIDVEGATYDVFFWLQENSYKYGFIFRYPGSKTDITGTAEEVWHYRYVGVEAATEMYEQGLCLEEYLEK